jgi:hypothetical protein
LRSDAESPVPLHHARDGAAAAPVLALGAPLGATLAIWEPLLEALGGRHGLLRFDHVIAAAEDPSTPPAHAEVIAAGITRARLEVLPDGAHLAVIERANEVVALIEQHLAAPRPQPS